jgi:hypothetical protein
VYHDGERRERDPGGAAHRVPDQRATPAHNRANTENDPDRRAHSNEDAELSGVGWKLRVAAQQSPPPRDLTNVEQN